MNSGNDKGAADLAKPTSSAGGSSVSVNGGTVLGANANTPSTAKSDVGGRQVDTNDDPEKHAERLEHEIEQLRDNIGGLVSELGHRGHRLNPVVAAKNHPVVVVVAASVLLGAVVGGIAWRRARVRRRDSWTERTKRLRKAVRRAVEKPEEVAEAEPSVGMKIFSAAATAVAAIVARKVATRLLQRTPLATAG